MAANDSLPEESQGWSRGYVEEAFLLLAMTLATCSLLINLITLAAIFAVRMKVLWLRLSLASLCIADACTSVATVALSSFRYHYATAEHQDHADTTTHRAEYCINVLCRYLWDASTNASIFTLFFMAVQLFASVRWPLQSSNCLSCPVVASLLAAIWLTSLVAGFTPAMLVATSAHHHKLQLWRDKAPTLFCYQIVLYEQPGEGDAQYKYDFGQAGHVRTHLLIELAATLFVLAALIGTYSYIFVVVRRKRHFTNSQLQASSSNGDRIGDRRLIIVVLLATAFFLVGYLPLYYFVTLTSLYPKWGDSTVFAVLMAIAAMSLIADPLLYSLRLKEIRTGLQKALSKAVPAKCAQLSSGQEEAV